jgi:1,4-dihydroxy-2-naphthoyl-CoA hydrolase
MSRFTGTLPNTLMQTLEIDILEATPERVVATMPVNPKVHQPYGLLHGGASVALAETVASVGGAVSVPEGKAVVGLEINANHLRGKRSGSLTATAIPVHKGRSTQVWTVEIVGEDGERVCVSRCTLAVINQP